jgi:hypothetical protein
LAGRLDDLIEEIRIEMGVIETDSERMIRKDTLGARMELASSLGVLLAAHATSVFILAPDSGNARQPRCHSLPTTIT